MNPEGQRVVSQPLNPTDAALWEIERNPALRTTIVAVLWLDRAVEPDRLRNELDAASRIAPRLRQRVIEGRNGLGPRWDVVINFDIADHLSFVEVRNGAYEARVFALAEELADTPFDRSKPLWSCTYVGGERGRAALIVQVHHSLTDGVGGIGLLDALLDADADAPMRDLSTIAEPRPASRARAITKDVDRVAHVVAAVSGDVASTARSVMTHPRRAVADANDLARSAVRMLAPTPRALSPLLTGRSLRRRVLTTELDLERLHRAATAQGCTINHVLFAGVVGGVAAYHSELGQPCAKLRALMPVDNRHGSVGEAGNQWAPVRFVVPTDIADPIERLHAMRDLLVASRDEPALAVSQPLAGLVQTLPAPLSSRVVGAMMQGVDLAVTDVPGLTEPRYVAGAAIERLFAFAPTAGSALNVSLVSHLSIACVGITFDAAAVTNPERMRDLIDAGLREVVTAAESSPAATRPGQHDRGVRSATPKVASPERLSALDTMFLRMETRSTPMHLGGVATTAGTGLRDADGDLRLDDARRHIEQRLALVPRFKRRLSEVPLGLGRPLWVDDPDFDIARHVHLAAAAEPGGWQQLLDLAALLHEQPLDRHHPLWEIWLVDGLAGGEVAVIDKVHHSLIDGLGGVELTAAIFDESPEPRPIEGLAPAPQVMEPGRLTRLGQSLAEQVLDPIDVARRSVGSLKGTPRRLLALARDVPDAARMLGPFLVTRPGPFNKPIGPRRTLRSVTVSFDLIDRIRNNDGGTVNDVILAAMAGALRAWFDEVGAEPFDVHVFVPVSTRSAATDIEPGNRVGGMLVALPVGEPDAFRRLRIVSERVGRLKSTVEADGFRVLLESMDHVPAIAMRAAAGVVAHQHFANLVITNVPGPRNPLYFMGERVEDLLPLLPLTAESGLGVAVMSYADRISISLLADPEVCPAVDELASALLDELAELSS